ncbi:Piso0_003176 [Millerozyma farinosa CBS 7064]|uniref:Piso0_003176 protein n=1 Tax=Pichia sorbitophila (strain ATCC MYA-4447 / BCRC 22081 / CBS 7064 / NBRC 10061 / NRRL Y-12695) TaxID=559304 RepID=G8YKJ8_PICSO|nr:Piso0_003176 [Millerozyma farinosa CBS 7064]CCE80843.1 Piso0_003176 [Millerozyma farinosa CBS 7064]
MIFKKRKKESEELPIYDLKPQVSENGDTKYVPKSKSSKWNTSALIKNVYWKIVLINLLIWLFCVNYFERTTLRSSLAACEWQRWEGWDKAARPHRIALVADPQLVDDHTYPGRFRLLTYFIKKLSDNYLFRNHRYVQTYLDPDTTIFLGDLFDGGRQWKPDAWMEEYKRFNKVYPKKPNRRMINDLPGNHDIGFESINIEARKRFSAFFGTPNEALEIGNHSFVILDTISLSSENKQLQEDSLEFLSTLNDHINPAFPRVLLTHVPLYRFTESQTCGPLRESKKPFPVMKGLQYQTVIDYEISKNILSTVKPTLVFSGDDHDYCDITHKYESDGVAMSAREITVKSASMTCGIKYPAIQLLSLHNPYDPKPKTTLEPDNTLKTKMCTLPKPYVAIFVYVTLLVVSIISFIAAREKNLKLFMNSYERGILPVSSGKHPFSFRLLRDMRQIDLWFLLDFFYFIVILYIVFGLFYTFI